MGMHLLKTIWINDHFPISDLYTKLIAEDGSTTFGWPEEGILVKPSIGIFSSGTRVIGEEVSNGILLIWMDNNDTYIDLHGQIISTDGAILWADNVIPLVDETYDSINMSVASNEENFYLVWQHFNGTWYDILMQKYDYNGSPIWDNNLIISSLVNK